MMVPGVTAVVGGITGGAVQVLRAGVNGAAESTSWLRDSATDTMQTLLGPVVESVSQTAGRFLGDSGNRTALPVRWRSGRRVHLDLA